MEPRRDAVRQVDGGDRGAGEIVGVEDDQLGRLARGIDHQPDQPTVALGRFGMARDEHEFAGIASFAEIAGLFGPGAEIMGEQATVGDKPRVFGFGQGQRPGAAIVAREKPRIGTREFLRRGIDRVAGDGLRSGRFS